MIKAKMDTAETGKIDPVIRFALLIIEYEEVKAKCKQIGPIFEV